jgi:hypothetical protein
MADQAVVKVKFKQPFYGPVVGDPKTMILYKKVEDLPAGNDGVYTFPADYPLPTTDIQIVEGTPTFKKPADRSPRATTQINPAVTAQSEKKSRYVAAR